MAKRSDIECRPAHELSPEERGTLRAQEFFVVQAQVTINRLMRDHGVSQAELARRLGVSEARVSSMFGNDKNFTLRTIGKILHALGEEAMLTTAREFEEQQVTSLAEVTSPWLVVKDFEDDADPVESRQLSKITLGKWAEPDRLYEERHGASVLNS